MTEWNLSLQTFTIFQCSIMGNEHSFYIKCIRMNLIKQSQHVVYFVAALELLIISHDNVGPVVIELWMFTLPIFGLEAFLSILMSVESSNFRSSPSGFRHMT